ncbi:MAG: hypothetical protein RMK17_00505 [bacterium]|nr:hypothetical protein [Patescibacteria group bacterium]MDW8279642.1 hypothetical protein [bacterium]
MNKLKILKIILILIIKIILIFSPLVFAQQSLPPDMPEAKIKSLYDVVRLIKRAINWLFYFLIILSVFFFMLAAFEYLISGGEKETIDRAKSRLKYGIYAIVLALLAKGIPDVVASFFGIYDLMIYPTTPTNPNIPPPPQTISI